MVSIDKYVYVSCFVCWKNREHRTLSRAIVGRKYANGHKSNDIINKTLTCPTTAL